VSEIATKLADALSMFWESLDERERRLLALGVAYVAAMIVVAPLERRRKQSEREELAVEVARILEARAGGGDRGC
jgi:type II secretory pathway component PulM